MSQSHFEEDNLVSNSLTQEQFEKILEELIEDKRKVVFWQRLENGKKKQFSGNIKKINWDLNEVFWQLEKEDTEIDEYSPLYFFVRKYNLCSTILLDTQDKAKVKTLCPGPDEIFYSPRVHQRFTINGSKVPVEVKKEAKTFRALLKDISQGGIGLWVSEESMAQVKVKTHIYICKMGHHKTKKQLLGEVVFINANKNDGERYPHQIGIKFMKVIDKVTIDYLVKNMLAK